MKLSKYEELTGTTVASANQAKVNAQINRTRIMLEAILGYPLCPPKGQSNLYNELGKAQEEYSCPDVDTDTLDDADEVEGSYRLFRYDSNDQHFHVDPFTTVYKVKLVYIRTGEDSGDDGAKGITVKTFDDSEISVSMGRDGWSKYITRHGGTHRTACKLQLAVDADWAFDSAGKVPYDLLYLWADMVTFYMDPKWNIKHESITTHSYTKADNKPPEQLSASLAVLKRYAGPHGSIYTRHVA